VLTACLVLCLAACGGDGDDSSSAAVTPTDTAGVAVGTISAFGSVFVNGVEFDDSRATVTINGVVTTRSRLREGMVVEVQGRFNGDGSAVADSIDRFDCVQGPITAINRVQNTVTVLGEIVDVGDDTVFDGVAIRDLNGFAIGDAVEVSCLQDRSGNRVRATRMERLGVFNNGVSDVDITGTVEGLDSVNRTCTIKGVAVTFAGITGAGVPAGLANGMTVRASGSNYTGGVLIADRLRDRDRDRLSYPDADRLEVEGYIESYVSPSDFKIDGQRVDASTAVFRNGTAADLANGLKVEAEGVLAGQVLVASVLRIREVESVRIEAGMQSSNVGASSLVVLGQTVSITADTVLTDRLSVPLQPQRIALSALSAGDRIELRAYKNSSGGLVAMAVQRTEADPLVVVKAAADSKMVATQLVLTGIGITTGPATVYRALDGSLLSANDFYTAVQVPAAVASVIHARGVVASLSSVGVDATRDTSSTGEVELVD
jgi:hypothetical protein